MSQRKGFNYVVGFALVLIASGLAAIVQAYLEPANLVMFYLAAVVIAATLLGRGPAIFTSVLSVVAFDVLFVPPKYSFTVHDTQYLVTFAGLLAVGLIISELTDRTRRHALWMAEETKRAELFKEKEKLQSALLNCISHDLRTPLVSVTGALSHLIDDEKLLQDEAYKEIIETAYQEVLRLNRILTNWLDMTRLEAGALKISRKPCSVKEVVGVALQDFNDQLKDRSVRVQVSDQLPEVAIDFSMLLKVIINLIDNALKYSPPTSLIELQAQAVGEKVEIKILDQGSGIPAHDLERIFDKFYRVANATNVSGTGLGLPICKGIVESYGGKIHAENRLSGGAIFVIDLPVSHEKDLNYAQ